MPSPHERLGRFLDEQMRMSQVYQPVMLEVLLTGEGRASIRSIAEAILAHDESQIDYYTEIVKRMPGRVLGQHGIVKRIGDDYVLGDDLHDLSEAERDDLIARCRGKVESFKQKRGTAIWEHRRPATGIIPGSVRYNTFKRAAGRCELCGVPHEERALDVDHIVPRSEGGTDDPDNLQALCWRCNQDKGAGDATDFRGIRESYATREPGCPFCELGGRKLIAENPLAVLIVDEFPVTEGHLLAIPRRHVADYFELRQPERNAYTASWRPGERICANSIRMSQGSTSASTRARPPGKPSSIATFT